MVTQNKYYLGHNDLYNLKQLPETTLNFMCATQRFKKKIIFCFYTTITQTTSVYQNVWMTGYFDWYVIVNVAYNMFIIGPISQDNLISSI